jgi:DNA-binding NtrC family response regulator
LAAATPRVPAKKIMVIDDERDILKLVQAALKRYGHEVDVFSEPIEALEHFRRHRGDYSLLLVDIRMPGMSGLEFAAHAKQAAPDVKILLMTAFEISIHEIQKGLQFVKVDDLLKKPFMLSKICEVIEKHLVSKMK